MLLWHSSLYCVFEVFFFNVGVDTHGYAHIDTQRDTHREESLNWSAQIRPYANHWFCRCISDIVDIWYVFFDPGVTQLPPAQSSCCDSKSVFYVNLGSLRPV